MFKEGTCPKCHETIQVPDDREQIICMYCGQEIRVDAALGRKHADAALCGEYYQRAADGLKKMIEDCQDPMKKFARGTYESEFEAFHSSHRELYEAIEYVYRNGEEPEAWLLKLAGQLVDAAKADLDGCRMKSKKTQRQLDLNMQISVYLIPSLLKYPADFSESFADFVLKFWNQEFQANVGKAHYEDIESGFRKKLCYITTAVCESLGKGTDCYELALLKEYRDKYLEPTPDGMALVEEYYNIAPTIVKRMEKEADREYLYKDLYQNYLKPCIEMIELKEYEACRAKYADMVLMLKARYMS